MEQQPDGLRQPAGQRSGAAERFHSGVERAPDRDRAAVADARSGSRRTAEAIHAIFRGFHTIKGMAGFLDLDAVRDVSHEVETILDLARNGELAITTRRDRPDSGEQGLSEPLDDGTGAMLATGQTPAAGRQHGADRGHPRLSGAPR